MRLRGATKTGRENTPFDHRDPRLCRSHLDETTAQPISVTAGSLTLLYRHYFIGFLLKKPPPAPTPRWSYHDYRPNLQHQCAKYSSVHGFSCSASLRHILVMRLQILNHEKRGVAFTHPRPVHTSFQSWILMNDTTRHRGFFFFFPPFFPLPQIKNDIKITTWLLRFYQLFFDLLGCHWISFGIVAANKVLRWVFQRSGMQQQQVYFESVCS